ncbi:hypothetical protein AAF712_011247 [Marasmius tenuissimus]|uniref:NAD(P)-binding protein n=1 Tax=Marasmius tenuissimus TaxID=585030 RepID=A0ABR2ZJY6_9AGAR
MAYSPTETVRNPLVRVKSASRSLKTLNIKADQNVSHFSSHNHTSNLTIIITIIMSDDYKRVILVTGSNTGIGYEIVKGLAQKGQTVYLAARTEAKGKEAQEKLKKENNLDVKLVLLNVEDLKSIEAARDFLEKAEGRLDVLVNNAGNGMGHPQSANEEMDVDILRAVFETNFFGLVNTTKTFLPLIRKAKPGYGNIVQNSMEWGACSWQASEKGHTQFATYSASKSAVHMYSIALANELKEARIRVNCCCPGFTTTALNKFAEGGKTPEQGAQVLVNWSLLGPKDDGKTRTLPLHINHEEDITDKRFTGLLVNASGEIVPW